jgi:transposase
VAGRPATLPLPILHSFCPPAILLHPFGSFVSSEIGDISPLLPASLHQPRAPPPKQFPIIIHVFHQKLYATRYRAAFTRQLEKKPYNRQFLAQLYAHLDFCRSRKAAHISILRELVRPFQQDQRNLMTYPGIGFIGACTLSAYLENGWRLTNKRKLWQYCGIGVRRHESAGKGRRGASRKGNRYLKNVVLTAAATIANRSRSDNALTRMWRAGIAAGIPGNRWSRNMDRKVAVLAQRSLRFKEEYQDDRIATTQ